MGALITPWVPMTQDEKTFFKALGARVAELRGGLGMTQQQFADLLGVTQQVIASYEIGRRRVPVSVLPALARALAVSVEDLIGEARQPGKRGPAPKIQQQLERITKLPKAQQRFIMQMIDTALQQGSG
jgi:transcriptional regulator with XRE-family HTH domain